MNDNRPQRARPIAIIDRRTDRYLGFQEEANACHCRSEQSFVDHEVTAEIGWRFFVWCINCGAEGPRAPTEGTAISVWNRATSATAD